MFFRLSGLDLPLQSGGLTTESPSPIEKVKNKLQEAASSSSAQNGVSSKVQVSQSVPESTFHLISQKPHKKYIIIVYKFGCDFVIKLYFRVEPSKEMQAAMKVLNDSLQKGPQNKNIKNQLKNATNIIQQEWFKVSSLVTANPLDVEDYLDAFEDVSSALLEYIVNMTDASASFIFTLILLLK